MLAAIVFAVIVRTRGVDQDKVTSVQVRLSEFILVITTDLGGSRSKQLLKPLVSLSLWIDHQGPLDRVGEDGRVLGGHVIGGEALVVPLR